MSEKQINDNTPYLNRATLGLPFYRELFVDPKTSTRADIYHTRKNTEATNHHLSDILSQGKNTNTRSTHDEYGKLISDVIVNSQQGYDNIGSGLESISSGIADLGYGIEGLSNNIESFAYELQESVSSIYGINLPEGQSLVDIGRRFSFNGKKSIVALYINGGIDSYMLKRLFGPNLIAHLNNGISTSDATSIQKEVHIKLSELKTLSNDIDGKISEQNKLLNKPDINDNDVYSNIDLLKEKKSMIEQTIKNLQSKLLKPAEVGLLDIGIIARKNNINTLIQKGIIDLDVLEVLVRNKKISGNLSSEFSRIIKVDENGVVRPLIELDGITGVFQQAKAQTMLQNIVVKQNDLANSHLSDINFGIKEGFDGTVGAINDGFHNTVDAINYNTGEIKSVNNTLKEGFIMTNYNLDRISNFVQETNRELGFVNQNLIKVNYNLEGISDRIGESNMYLHDILSVGHMGNDLLAYNNELQQETNAYLDAINQTIIETGEGLMHILQGVGEMIWDGFEQTVQGLNNISILQNEQLKLNAYTLEEISKQTLILGSIERQLGNVNINLQKPYFIRANEAFLQGNNCLRVSNVKLAIKSFKKGLNQDSTHIGNVFGLGVIYNAVGKNKKAETYLNMALNIALSNQNPISKQIYYELAKLNTKKLNLRAGEELLQKSINFNENRVEIYLMRLDLLIKLGDSIAVDILLNDFFTKISSGDYDLQGTKNHKQLFKYLEPEIKVYLDHLKSKHKITDMINSIGFLSTLGYDSFVGEILELVVTNYPDLIYKNKLNINSSLVKDNKRLYLAIKNFAKKKHIAGDSNTFFYIAQQCYQKLDQSTVNLLISQGLEFDLNYIYMQQSDNANIKLQNKNQLIQKLYSLGDNAKYMLRDYLKLNKIFS